MAKYGVFGHLNFNWGHYQDNQFYMVLQVKFLSVKIIYNNFFHACYVIAIISGYRTHLYVDIFDQCVSTHMISHTFGEIRIGSGGDLYEIMASGHYVARLTLEAMAACHNLF